MWRGLLNTGDPRLPGAAGRARLTQRFGGVTAYTRSSAERRWLADRTHVEDVVVFEVLCSELDRHWWNAYRQRIENGFRQQSVVIRAKPALLF